MGSTFHLQIASLDGLMYDGQVQSVSCRTIHGDLAILAHHMNYCTAIGMGKAVVVLEDGTKREAACIGGMTRAEASKRRAEEKMAQTGLSEQDYKMAESKLHRALVRIGTARQNRRN